MATLTLTVCCECTAALKRAIGALAEGFAQSAQLECFSDRFPGLFDRDLSGQIDLSQQFGDMIFTGDGCGAAGWAGNGILSLQPSEEFRELVTALAADVHGEVIEVHGWPVLSLVPAFANVTEAEALQQGLGGGFHRDLPEGDA